MSENRRLRAFLVAVASFGVLLSLAAPADAAPPRRVAAVKVSLVTPSPTNQQTATFTFSTVTPSVRYTCSLDGARAASCTSPRTYSGSVLGAGTHTLRVTAARIGYKSATGAASVVVDLTAPAAPTVSGVPGATNSPISPTFTDTSTDVIGYQCRIDGAVTFTACTSGAPITGLVDGTHTLQVRAVDRATNVSPATTVSWVLDTIVAKPFISGGPAAQIKSAGSVAFYFGDADADATFACSINGKQFVSCVSGATFNDQNGANTFQVRATDSLGNAALSDPYTWTVSNATTYALKFDPGTLPSPVTSIRAGTITFSLSPASATLTCTLDGVTLAGCSAGGTAYSVAYSASGDGGHTFTVMVDAGLSSQNSLSYSWQLDTTAPSVPAIHGPPARTNVTSASIAVVPSGLGDTLACTVTNPPAGSPSAPVACGLGVPISLSALADGIHTVTAAEKDAAGNTAMASYAWVVDTVAPVATITVQTAITGFASVVLNEDGTAAGTSPALVLSSGAAVATRRVCLSSLGAVVACTSTAVRTVRLYAASPLLPGENYVVKVNAPGSSPLTDAAGNAAPAVSRSFRAALLQQENSPATVQTWRRIVTTAAKGGSYVVEGRAGATAAWRFTGTAFTAYLAAGPTFGLAKVYVDGALRTTWNQYASRLRFTSAHVVKGLPARTHTVTIVVAGKKGSRAAAGVFVGIDAFAAGSSLQRTPSLTQRWARVKAAGAYGLYRSLTALPGETFTMRFAGTGIRWVHPTGPAYGLAAVYVDGVKKATVDSYSASARDRVVWTSTTLAAGRHTFRIVTLGTKRAVSKGTLVSVDFLQVR